MNALAEKYYYATDEEYFTLENHSKNRDSEIRYEMIDGLIYAMSGGSLNHGRIIGNLNRIISQHLLNSSCEVFTENTKVKLTHKIGKSDYVYPDVVVDCSPENAEDNMLVSPKLVIEVLSSSTRHKDENAKFQAYIKMPTVEEFVIIEQDIAKIEVQRRVNHWAIEKFILGDEVSFSSIGLTVVVADIYHKVNNGEMKAWLEKLTNNDGMNIHQVIDN